MAYLIEKNVPIPTDSRGRELKYPLKKMQVGDSFVVPANDVRWGKHTNGGRQINGVSQSVSYFQRKYGGRFTVRIQPDSSVRVWRIG